MDAKNKFTYIELFAGAGVFGTSFKKRGFSPLLAVELDKTAAKSYMANLGDNIVIGNVKDVSVNIRCDVLIGGPPCQGFSTLGKRQVNDPRNGLCLEMVRWAEMVSPKIIVIENVSVFIKSQEWNQLTALLEKKGYKIESYILDSSKFGVPQIRNRSITIASRVEIPKITSPCSKIISVREAWEGLPVMPNSKGLNYAPIPSELALSRMKLIPPGGDKRDIIKQAPNLSPCSWFSTQSAVTDVWGRMHWDRPANTVRTCFLNPSKGRYIHPEQNRVISLREGARLQSIPDSFKFLGTPTQIARQIGNCVPSKLGDTIAASVKTALLAS